ncbi:MAG: transporter [Bacteroidales bacterium]
MMRHIKTFMLPTAMLLGILFYKEIEYVVFLSPYLIFLMLFVTYCRLSIRDLKITRLHLWMLIIQVGGALAVYSAILPFNRIIAEGAFICIFCPTATSAPVITSMLGGSIASVISYSILSNLAVAVLSPFVFSFVGGHTTLPFAESFLIVARQMLPLIVAPLILAILLKKAFPAVHKFMYEAQSISFYLWAIALILVLGKAMGFIVSNGSEKVDAEGVLSIFALIVCGLQFYLGKRLGSHYGDRIAGGQGLGQKNTVLCIWMAFTYLSPMSSVAPASYIIWQNIINSYQLIRANSTSTKCNK